MEFHSIRGRPHGPFLSLRWYFIDAVVFHAAQFLLSNATICAVSQIVSGPRSPLKHGMRDFAIRASAGPKPIALMISLHERRTNPPVCLPHRYYVEWKNQILFVKHEKYTYINEHAVITTSPHRPSPQATSPVLMRLSSTVLVLLAQSTGSSLSTPLPASLSPRTQFCANAPSTVAGT